MKYLKLYEGFFKSKKSSTLTHYKKFNEKLSEFLKTYLKFKLYKKSGFLVNDGKLMKISYFLNYKDQTFLVTFYDDETEEIGIIIYNMRKELRPKIHTEIIEKIGNLDYFLIHIFDTYSFEKVDKDNFSITYKFKEDKLDLILSELTKENVDMTVTSNKYNL